MNVFDHDNYLIILEKTIERNGVRGFKRRLAEAMGCHPSFLSQVLHGGEVHLTMDHGWGFAKFMNFNNLETEFFLTLLQRQRSSSRPYREKLTRDLRQLKGQSQQIASRVQAPDSEMLDHDAHWYYSQWIPSAIHMLISTSEFASEPKIAARLTLPSGVVTSTCRRLSAMGLIREGRGPGAWVCTERNLHMGSNSPFVDVYHEKWRLRALNSLDRSMDEDIHYTNVQSLTLSGSRNVTKIFLDAIQESQEVAADATGDDIFVTTLDVFRP